MQTTVSMAEIAQSQRLLRVRLVCRGCKFRPFIHANSPRLSLVCVYAWHFWPIVSAFVFSQRQLSLSASMHNTPADQHNRSQCRSCMVREGRRHGVTKGGQKEGQSKGVMNGGGGRTGGGSG